MKRFDAPDETRQMHKIQMKAGDVFYIPPAPHDRCVVGDQAYVALRFLGADHYAKQ